MPYSAHFWARKMPDFNKIRQRPIYDKGSCCTLYRPLTCSCPTKSPCDSKFHLSHSISILQDEWTTMNNMFPNQEPEVGSDTLNPQSAKKASGGTPPKPCSSHGHITSLDKRSIMCGESWHLQHDSTRIRLIQDMITIHFDPVWYSSFILYERRGLLRYLLA